MKIVLLALALLIGLSYASETLGRVSHKIYFQQERFQRGLDIDGKGIDLLNTQIGQMIYDRKQNIGIVLSPGPDYDLCSSNNFSQAKKLQLTHIYNLQMFLFINISGNCAFGSQIQEAELIGAKGVILYDPIGTINDNPYPRINVEAVSIPVLIMANKNEGSKMLELMKKEDKEESYALCKLSYSTQKKLEFPTLIYYYSSLDKSNLSFIKEVFAFIKEYDIAQKLQIKAVPMIYNSTELYSMCQQQSCIETSEKQIFQTDCYSNGKYCTIHKVNYLQALDALDHELFQYVLSRENSLQWSQYMKAFITDCLMQAEIQSDPLDMTDCGESIIKSYDQPLLNSVLKKINDSWKVEVNNEGVLANKNKQENSLFGEIRNLILSYGVHQYPTIILNDQLIQQGNLLLKDNLAKLLCKSYSSLSEACSNLLQYGASQKDDDFEYQEDDKGDDFNPDKAGKVIKPRRKHALSNAFIISISLIIGAMLGAIIFYFVRRDHIRQMNSLLDKKVRQAVQKYKKFNSANAQFQELG